METNLSKNQKKIKYTMCGRSGSCCPVLTEIENDSFTITDDFNGTVKLKREELLLLKDFLNSEEFSNK